MFINFCYIENLAFLLLQQLKIRTVHELLVAEVVTPAGTAHNVRRGYSTP